MILETKETSNQKSVLPKFEWGDAKGRKIINFWTKRWRIRSCTTYQKISLLGQLRGKLWWFSYLFFDLENDLRSSPTNEAKRLKFGMYIFLGVLDFPLVWGWSLLFILTASSHRPRNVFYCLGFLNFKLVLRITSL